MLRIHCTHCLLMAWAAGTAQNGGNAADSCNMCWVHALNLGMSTHPYLTLESTLRTCCTHWLWMAWAAGTGQNGGNGADSHNMSLAHVHWHQVMLHCETPKSKVVTGKGCTGNPKLVLVQGSTLLLRRLRQHTRRTKWWSRSGCMATALRAHWLP